MHPPAIPMTFSSSEAARRGLLRPLTWLRQASGLPFSKRHPRRATKPAAAASSGGALRLLPAGICAAVERDCFTAEMNLLRSGLRFETTRPDPIVSHDHAGKFRFPPPVRGEGGRSTRPVRLRGHGCFPGGRARRIADVGRSPFGPLRHRRRRGPRRRFPQDEPARQLPPHPGSRMRGLR